MYERKNHRISVILWHGDLSFAFTQNDSDELENDNLTMR